MVLGETFPVFFKKKKNNKKKLSMTMFTLNMTELEYNQTL